MAAIDIDNDDDDDNDHDDAAATQSMRHPLSLSLSLSRSLSVLVFVVNHNFLGLFIVRSTALLGNEQQQQQQTARFKQCESRETRIDDRDIFRSLLAISQALICKMISVSHMLTEVIVFGVLSALFHSATLAPSLGLTRSFSESCFA